MALVVEIHLLCTFKLCLLPPNELDIMDDIEDRRDDFSPAERFSLVMPLGTARDKVLMVEVMICIESRDPQIHNIKNNLILKHHDALRYNLYKMNE